jgi:hypothetical protein
MMEGLGFVQDPTGYKILNEYRYVATTWLYNSAYATDESLRPHLSLEFTVRTPKFPAVSVPIGYLVLDRKPRSHSVSMGRFEIRHHEVSGKWWQDADFWPFRGHRSPKSSESSPKTAPRSRQENNLRPCSVRCNGRG